MASTDIVKGAFWISLGATLQPSFNAQGAYLASATTPDETAKALATFSSSFGMFLPIFKTSVPDRL
jgi:hypothetical protein